MRRLLTFIKCDQFIRSDRGGALAELAILIPFLVVMIAAVSELGRLFQTYTALSKSTRAAARYMSNNAYDTTHIERAKNVAVCGKTNCDGIDPVVPNLTAANIEVNPNPEFAETGGGNPTTVSVSVVNYNFQPIFNLGALIGNDRLMSLPAGGSTTMYYMWVDPAGVEE